MRKMTKTRNLTDVEKIQRTKLLGTFMLIKKIEDGLEAFNKKHKASWATIGTIESVGIQLAQIIDRVNEEGEY